MTYISESVRKQVQDRANNRCEYCYKPEYASFHGFHVDHIVPIKHGGTSELENLAWACLECNVNNGRDISSYDEFSGELTPLFNPRTQLWADHFVLDDHAIVHGKTPVGRVTIHMLNMNHISQIEIRRRLMNRNLW